MEEEKEIIADSENSKNYSDSSKTEVFADLHIHSRFSRATSKSIDIPNLVMYAKIKGINLLGTGDFQHPFWIKELEVLEEKDGLLYYEDFPFLWQTEISLMYSQDGKGRRIHFVILAPNKETANQIKEFLASKGRLDYDGRPIFGFSSIELAEEMEKISRDIEIIPAHCLLPSEEVFCEDGLVAISKIKKGQRVLSHKGRFKNVDKILRRGYKGYLVRVKPSYFGGSLVTTPEHPYYAIKTKKNCNWIKGTCKPVCSQKNCKKKSFLDYRPEWILAKDLEKDDILVYPIIKGESDRKIGLDKKEEPDLWRLIGYYLAEGWSNGRDGIGFCFRIDEKKYIDDLIFLIGKYLDKEVKLKFRDKSIEILIYSKKIMKLFEDLFYEGEFRKATTKILPSWVLFLPLEKQKELFVGWWRGDFGSTSSKQLFNQMKNIVLRLGVIPNVNYVSKENFNKTKHLIKEKNKFRRIEASSDHYQIHYLTFFWDNFNLLEDKEFVKFKRKINRFKGWLDESYAYLPITQIFTEEYDGEVYNLEVEEDNSYITNFAVVHNCMTPWFGIFGSKSGFDSLQECFQEKVDKIHVVESGMSADPKMLRNFSFLNNKGVISFSDMHSFWPWRIGRESTIFTGNLSYKNILKQIRENSFKATVEVDPAYGKYHYDGHRACNFSCNPEESKKLNNICPKCGRQLVIGVENRVEELADNPKGFIPKNAKPFYKLLPLHELIALAKASTLTSKKTWQIYNQLIDKFGNEFNILLFIEKEELARFLLNDEQLVQLIIDNRNGKIRVKPGYDGVYGEPMLKERQEKLF